MALRDRMFARHGTLVTLSGVGRPSVEQLAELVKTSVEWKTGLPLAAYCKA